MWNIDLGLKDEFFSKKTREEELDVIVEIYINSYYSYAELITSILGEYTDEFLISEQKYDESFLINRYGKKKLQEFREHADVMKTLSKVARGKVLLKSYYARKIVPETLIYVDEYECKLIENVVKFFQNNGDSTIVNEKTGDKAISSLLHDPKLKNLLRFDAYQKLQKLLEIDDILLTDRMSDKRTLISNVINCIINSQYDLRVAAMQLQLDTFTIERIINSGYAKVYCHRNHPDFYEKLLNIKNKMKILLENGCSLKEIMAYLGKENVMKYYDQDIHEYRMMQLHKNDYMTEYCYFIDNFVLMNQLQAVFEQTNDEVNEYFQSNAVRDQLFEEEWRQIFKIQNTRTQQLHNMIEKLRMVHNNLNEMLHGVTSTTCDIFENYKDVYAKHFLSSLYLKMRAYYEPTYEKNGLLLGRNEYTQLERYIRILQVTIMYLENDNCNVSDLFNVVPQINRYRTLMEYIHHTILKDICGEEIEDIIAMKGSITQYSIGKQQKKKEK